MRTTARLVMPPSSRAFSCGSSELRSGRRATSSSWPDRGDTREGGGDYSDVCVNSSYRHISIKLKSNGMFGSQYMARFSISELAKP